MVSKQEKNILLNIVDIDERIREINGGGYIPPNFFKLAIKSLECLKVNSKILIKEYKKKFKKKVIKDNNW